MFPYITKEVSQRADELFPRLTAFTDCGVDIENRVFWDHVNLDRESILREANENLEKPFPEITDEIYFDRMYRKEGFRSDNIAFSSMRMLEKAVLAECIENEGRFLAYIENAVHSICSRRSWVRAGHDSAYGFCDYYGKHKLIDLYSSSLGWRFAVCDSCLKNRLSMNSRQEIRDNVKKHVLDPFMQRLYENPDDILINNIVPIAWLDGFDNWLAVCLSGVLGSFLYFGEKKEKALVIAFYEKQIQSYLGSLPDGYCVEGLSYWGYGFGKFIAASDSIYRATDGYVDLYGQDGFLAAAEFGHRIALIPDVYPSVADCGYETKPLTFCMDYLDMRIGKKLLSGPVSYSLDIYIVMMLLNPYEPLRGSLSSLSEEDQLHTHYGKQQILISRNENQDLGIYMQGGHNHMPHNHNDIGSFIIASKGETFIADPGFTVYDGTTFGPTRYSRPVLSSFGHSVPTVDGQLQGPSVYGVGNLTCRSNLNNESLGEIKYKATVVNLSLSAEKDEFSLDLSKAYDLPDFQCIRTFVFDRKNETITVTDRFSGKQRIAFESALITFCPIDILGSHSLKLKGKKSDLLLNILGDVQTVSCQSLSGAVAAADHNTPIYPMRISYITCAAEGTLSFVFSRK